MGCLNDSNNYVAPKGNGYAVIVNGAPIQDSWNNPLNISLNAAQNLYNNSGGPGPCGSGNTGSTNGPTQNGGSGSGSGSAGPGLPATAGTGFDSLVNWLQLHSFANQPNYLWVGAGLVLAVVIKNKR